MRADQLSIPATGEKLTGLKGKTILIESDDSNTQNILVGVIPGSSRKGAKGFPLKPGRAISIEGYDENELWLAPVSGAVLINYIVLEPMMQRQQITV